MNVLGRRPRVGVPTVLALIAAVAAVVWMIIGCGGASETTSTTEASAATRTTVGATPTAPDDGEEYAPEIDPADFVDGVDNPYLPLVTGATWIYEGETDEGTEHIEVTVLGERRTVLGIDCVVVRDTVTLDGELVEDTYDWYAQDVDGNVWYMGEEVKNYEGGELVDTAGSWEAGVDGALPGIVMWSKPRPGEPYRQEYYKGEAEDMAQIAETGRELTTALDTFSDVLVIREWTPLEPDVLEQKYYAPGVGMIREEVLEGGGGIIDLIEHRLP